MLSESIFRLAGSWLAKHPRAVDALIQRAMRTPYTHLQGYMERFWLFNPYDRSNNRRFNLLPFSVRIHHILREDFDRHDHDHPWDARTIILKGWYVERRDGGYFMRETGSTATLNFGEYHTIMDVSPGGVWTLFITFKFRGVWGFRVNGKKVHWQEYERARGAL